MRPSAGPLLSVSKGRAPLGSRIPRGLTLTTLKWLAAAAAIALVVLGLARLLGSDGGDIGGKGSGTMPWTVSELEAALQAQHGVNTEEGPDSMAAVRKRFEKAVALPDPAYRSHGSGMTLSPGAAAAAAACTGAACDLVRRFVLAAAEAAALSDSGGCAVQSCPDALGIGLRPLPYTSFAFGNRCEPLYNRGALEVVRQLIDGAGMRGLEWFTGSSTAWFLSRLAHLTSIETAKGFADKARSVAEAQFEPAWLDSGWDLRLIPPQAPVTTFADTESGEVFEEYCALHFLAHGVTFDVISVQGFARMACLSRAVQLLVPQGGLLVLRQAQRPAYKGAADIVPSHWLRLSDSHDFGETLVWMSMQR